MAERPPSDIARETLKQLAQRRLPPTPEHFRQIYDEIAGASSPLPFPELPLRQILRIIPGQTPAQKRLLEQFESAVNQKDWSAMQTVLVGYAKLGASTPAAHLDAAPATTGPAPLSPTIGSTVGARPGTVHKELAEQLARLIEHTLHGLSSDDARVHLLGEQLVGFLRQPDPPASTLQLMLGNFTFRLSFAAEDQAAIRSMLLELLNMVFTNITALSIDDQWLHGQAEALVAATAQPLTLRRLDDVQRRLKDVIFKQTEAKGRMVEAQDQMKEMLATFIERLSAMTDASSGYQNKMERYAEQISQASRIEDITPVLGEVVQATRTMALDTRLAHAELTELRERTAEKQAEMTRLQKELDQASAQARHDPLTGSLNRKGLDEVMEREIARAPFRHTAVRGTARRGQLQAAQRPSGARYRRRRPGAPGQRGTRCHAPARPAGALWGRGVCDPAARHDPGTRRGSHAAPAARADHTLLPAQQRKGAHHLQCRRGPDDAPGDRHRSHPPRRPGHVPGQACGQEPRDCGLRATSCPHPARG